MTKLIPLSQGKHAIVDDEDYDFLMQWKWYYNGRYVARRDRDTGRIIYMHWEIIGKPEKGNVVDHINGNSLNSQKKNLRICTPAENMRNRKKTLSKVSSQYKGVTWHKQASKWTVHISINFKKKYLGLFTSELDAAKAYDTAAREYHGDFARLNFPESD